MSGSTEYAALKWMRVYVDSLEKTTTIAKFSAGKSEAAYSSIIMDRAGRGIIRLHAASARSVFFRIVDARGRTVFTRAERFSTAGEHTISFPARNAWQGILRRHYHGRALKHDTETVR